MENQYISDPPYVGNMDLMSESVDHYRAANYLFKDHKFFEAAILYREAIKLSQYTSSRFQYYLLLNYSTSLYKSGDYAESKRILCELMKTTHKYSPSSINLKTAIGHLHMIEGDYVEGFKKMNSYRGSESFDGRSFMGCAKFWDGGSEIYDKRIFLISDGLYGIGDCISLIRFAKQLSTMGALVSVELSPSFNGIEIEGVEVVPYPAQPYWVGDNFEYVTYQFSLPYLLKTELKTLPTQPYITPNNTAANKWASKIDKNNRMRVGVCWSGSNIGIDEERFFHFDKLQPLFDLDIEFHSLQIEYSEDEINALNNSRLINHASSIHSLSDTAALIKQMDLVISVDTSVAHLAGAMGHPLCVLLPNYKNYYWNGDKPHWYPHAKPFRQPAEGDWGSVINRVKSHLMAIDC